MLHYSVWPFVAFAAGTCLAYLVVVVVVYNLFFHPLRHFPGPWLNRITQIPHTLLMLCGFPHKEHLELHLKYGPVVRIGPNMLSFNHPDAMKDVRGHRKAGEPEHGKDPISVQFAGDNIVGSDRENHTRFRRALAYGFSAQAMLEQEPTFKSYVNQLFQKLHEQSCGGKEPVDISKWYTFTTFDMIGDLAFGESFGCLDNSTYHPWVALAFESLKSVAFLAEIGRYPSLAPLAGLMLPRGLLTKFAENKELAIMKVRKRLDTKTDRPDFVGKITQGLKSKGTSMKFDELASNASVLIVAGSETTATLLSAAVYFLCADARTLGLLTQEVRTTYVKAEDIDLISTQNLRYMQAVLDEALRMYPPVAGGGSPRTIAKGGSLVAGYYVPEDTLVENDMWALHYDPKYFTQPHDFVPERWLGDPRFKNDRLDAVKPFSIGPRNCIGMNLAYAEMRMMLARTVWEFDLRLAEDSRNWYDESRVYLAWHKPALNVYLVPR
uniref:Cytochrome P450 monooxygenase n=4 Tax=Fusarium incarnatum-equiseti species complex TaxID=450425 RepID=D2JM20_9HYPO|nr:cytochrome P450 monooxygenase [Fusarium incarnatum]